MNTAVIVILIVISLIALLIYFFWGKIPKLIDRIKQRFIEPHTEKSSQNVAHHQSPKVSFPERLNPPKSKGADLNLADLNPGLPKAPTETPPNALPINITNSNQGSTSAPPTNVHPAEFEKTIEVSMTALINQAKELTRQFKLAEKSKTDLTTSYNTSTNTLNAEIARKNTQIEQLESVISPSLRALIEVRKLCQDMLSTQKPMEHDALVNFITGKIDDKLLELDIKTEEFTPGTPLEKIPGERVELSPKHEITDELSKVNHVAKLLRPCYYFERDSKRIIIAKAIIILYQLSEPKPPSATPLDNNPTL